MRYNITASEILQLSANKDVFSRGEKYYRDGNLLSMEVVPFGDLKKIRASIKGNYRNYDVTLLFEEDGHLREHSCNCTSESIWKGACKHAVAALFAVLEGRDPHRTQKEVIDSSNLVGTLEQLVLKEIDDRLGIIDFTANSRLAKLLPRFHYGGGGEAYLTFYVGYARTYIIRNIHRFVQAVIQSKSVRYGTGLEFVHSRDVFNRDSKAWLDFLLSEEQLYKDTAKRIGRSYSAMLKDDSREVYLSPRNIDIFFETCMAATKNGSIAFIPNEYLTQISNAPPEIKFCVSYNDAGESLVIQAPQVQYSLIKGQKWHYILTNRTLHRMSITEASILQNLLDALSDSGSEIEFTAHAYRRFVSIILPKLRQLNMVEETTFYTEPRLAANVRFDLEDGDCIAELAFEYGTNYYDGFEEAAGITHVRDIPREYAIKQTLRAQGFVTDEQRRLFRLSGNDLLFAFLGDNPPGIDTIKKLADVYVTDALAGTTITAPMASVGVRIKGHLLDVYLHQADFTLAELVAALQSYKEKKKYHLLKDGRILSLTDSNTAKMADTLESLNVEAKDLQDGKLTLPVYTAPFLGDKMLEQDTAFKRLIRRFNQRKTMAAPPSLKGILRPYQEMGFRWLKTISDCGFGGILADDMGLGKTLQVIAVLLSEKEFTAGASAAFAESANILPSLVVAPTSLLYNWLSELKRFAPGLKVTPVTGVSERRKEILLDRDERPDLFITTYETMKRDAEAYQELEFNYLIADEAQNIKNPTTKNARILKSIHSRCRFALTGTPIENSLSELWSIFDFVMPGYLYSAAKFSRVYEQPIVRENDYEKAHSLKQQIAPFILRRIKRNVLEELPPKTETTLIAEMYTEQKKLYASHLASAKGELKEFLKAKNNRMQILAKLTRLRQICCHPSLCVENYHGGSGKLDLSLEVMKNAIESGHRVLLFSQFTEMLGILQKSLDELGIEYFYLDGSVPSAKRMESVERFNNGQREVFLISLKAGGTGLNLTGADVVIHYDPWWNPSVMEQASDRAYRMGQERSVQIYNLVTIDSLEERIMELQEKKRKLIDTVLEEEGLGFMTGPLSDEELGGLLE